MIHQKIVKVMREVERVIKDVEIRTKRESYMGVSHDAVSAMVRGPMAEAGIAMAVRLLDSTCTKEGGMVFYEGRYLIRLVDSEDGTSEEYIVEAHAADFLDKAPGKALSYAVKMALLKAFLLPTGENDEERVAESIPQTQQPQKITKEQAEELKQLIEETGTNIDTFMKWADVSRLEDLDDTKYIRALKILERKKNG